MEGSRKRGWTICIFWIWNQWRGAKSIHSNCLLSLNPVALIFRFFSSLNLGKTFPRGRSWHSFTYVGAWKAVLYGGLSADGEVLGKTFNFRYSLMVYSFFYCWKGDCWTYDIRHNNWTEIPLKMSDRRLWHQSVHIDSECIVIGGVRSNIIANQQEAIVNTNPTLVFHYIRWCNNKIHVVLYVYRFTPTIVWLYQSLLERSSGLKLTQSRYDRLKLQSFYDF